MVNHGPSTPVKVNIFFRWPSRILLSLVLITEAALHGYQNLTLRAAFLLKTRINYIVWEQ